MSLTIPFPQVLQTMEVAMEKDMGLLYDVTGSLNWTNNPAVFQDVQYDLLAW
ncbi:MAG: hypothetical protein IPP43_13640 [Chitinophagaceae bacterium]|nr:hypothetical protein [Chitinophagaceae bacterium]